MRHTLRTEYAGVFMRIGDATNLIEAAAVVRVAAQSAPVVSLRVTDPPGELLDPAVLLQVD